MMRVSTITPVYNNELYIEECLISLLSQTYTNIEIIVIDDGSTDKSWDIIDRFNDSRLIKLRNTTNRGISEAYNKALTVATGDVLMFLDADDIAAPQRAEKTVEAFAQDPSVGLVYSDMDIIDSNTKPFDLKLKLPNEINKNNYSMYLWRRGLFTGSGMSVRKLTSLSFNSNVICCDYDISLFFAYHNWNYHYINESLTHYRIHNQNTSNQSDRMKSDVLAVQSQYSNDQLVNFWLEKGLTLSEINTTIGINYYYFHNDYDRALLHLNSALSETMNYEALFYKSIILFIGEKYAEAYELLKEAIRLHPTCYAILNNLAVMEIRLNSNTEKALSYLNLAKQYQPYYMLISKNIESVKQQEFASLKTIHYISDDDAVYRTYCRLI